VPLARGRQPDADRDVDRSDQPDSWWQSRWSSAFGAVAEPVTTYDQAVQPATEQIEILPDMTEVAQPHGGDNSRPEPRRRLSAMWVAVVLLAALCGLAAVGVTRLNALVDRTESLIVEQQRTTCYERLQWLGDPFDNHPDSGDLRVGASRHCEGDEPLTGFEAE
jgi:hypothetical protein